MFPKILLLFGQIFLAWAWILFPLILFGLSIKIWLWWRQEKWETKQNYVLLEIIPPPENKKPFKSMELFFSNVWGIYSSLKLVKIINKWIHGRKMYHLSLEITNIDEQIHMYIRARAEHRDTIEAAIYSQFPNSEIRAVRDYIEEIPFHTPNKKWNLYGFDLKLNKPDVYPIKTFSSFFEERSDPSKEEKRIDPIVVLFEGLKRLKPDEQIWLQIRIQPTTSRESNYLERGRRIINKLTFRDQKPPTREEKKESFIPPEMKLTAREREIVKAIETKISKPVFKTNIRCLYFGRREIFQRGRRTLAEQYFNGFNTTDLNSAQKWSKTKTRIYNFFVKRRLFFRKRNIFRRYILRETPLFPKNQEEKTFILNTEELATIFHFPVEAEHLGSFVSADKKAEAPYNLPTPK